MTDTKTPARPPQVTMAGWVTVGASVFMLISVFTFVSNLRSLDTREGVQDALDREPLNGTGLGLERALSLMHGAALVAGACAAAAAILGWFVLQRNHQARIALTVVVVPLFVTGVMAAGFLASMVAVSVVLLWARPARDWFNGVTPQPPQRRDQFVAPPPQHRSDHGQQEPEQPASGTRQDPPVGPRAFEGFGDRPTSTGQVPAQQFPPQQPQQYAPQHPAPSPYASARNRPPLGLRPREVVQACITTWVVCGVVVIGMLVALIGFVAMPDLVQDIYESDSRFAEADVSLNALRAASIVVAAGFVLWAAAALVLAWLTFAGHNWARVTLIVSASLSAMISLLMVISSPALLLVTITSVLVIVSLTRPASAEWFTRAGQQRAGGQHPPR